MRAPMSTTPTKIPMAMARFACLDIAASLAAPVF
jgi:hypothetical protein